MARLAEAIANEAARWYANSVLPEYVVMTWDVAETLAVEDQRWSLWGIPIIVAVGLPAGSWALGTDKPSDADVMRRLPSEGR